MTVASVSTPEVEYPDSDGEPMADNDTQRELMMTLRVGFSAMFERLGVEAYVSANSFWYPIEGDNRTRRAPDTYVALGRPGGERPSYRQWLEGDHPPDLVIEIVTARSQLRDYVEKFEWYDRHGAGEYLAFEPVDGSLVVAERRGDRLTHVIAHASWISQRTGAIFEVVPRAEPTDFAAFDLVVTAPDGVRFRTPDELSADNAALASDNAALASDNAALASDNARLLALLHDADIDPT